MNAQQAREIAGKQIHLNIPTERGIYDSIIKKINDSVSKDPLGGISWTEQIPIRGIVYLKQVDGYKVEQSGIIGQGGFYSIIWGDPIFPKEWI